MSINVLVADDSAFQRKIISEMLSKNKFINVIDMARNGLEVIEKVEKFRPDVLVLDLIMPHMDGLTAFKQIMAKYPTPTIIFSVLDPNSLDRSVQALLMGAFDYIMKPGGEWKIELPKFQNELISKVLMASKSQIKSIYQEKSESNHQKLLQVRPKPIKKVKKIKFISSFIPELKPIRISHLESNVIVMGASVGGPKTLKSILSKVPKDISSPILVVQHLNEHFVDQFGFSLSESCEINIKIGENGEYLIPGTVYIAPGNHHMEISVKNNRPCISLNNGAPVNYCIPSIDVLFFSAVRVYKNNTLGILLTGMGEDGVIGLGAIQNVGGKTLAESKETCVLYGMPKIAAERGVADLILPNYEIQEQIQLFSKKL
ncbi:MAG: chemotaxis-specific protein-glutamate methyltransferase CheB [Promethearchaeota archaeon]